METSPPGAPKRRFAGRRPAPGGRVDGLGALAETLLSAPKVSPAAPAPAAGEPAPGGRVDGLGALAETLLSAPKVSPAAPAPAAGGTSPPTPGPAPDEAGFPLPPEADPPRGLYVLVAAGIDPARRRSTALAVAASLAPHGRPAAVLLFEGGRADAHVLGEPACGRLGPQPYLGDPDAGRAAADLVGQCDQVAVIPLDAAADIGRLGPAAGRAVFVASPDAESLVETYRELKWWRARGLVFRAALFVVGAGSADEAARLHRRLRRAARRFLDCDVESQGFLPASAGGAHPEPLRVFAQAPAAEVWPRLLAAAAVEPAAPGLASGGPAAPAPVTDAPATVADTRDVTVAARPAQRIRAGPASAEPGGAFSAWQVPDRASLLAAAEAQAPALVGGALRQVLRVEVDEPGAPPLVAVRQNGALVAIVIGAGAKPADPQAACRWLAVHRALLARAYPRAGILEDAEPAAVVLAPLDSPAADGTRRFLPVRMGGRCGIVLVP